MGSEPLLQRACEFAFAVARQDAEADPGIEPPGDMRSFLYLARLPRRAIAVAQQAIEDDSDFRARVAAEATESDVGRAGYLWLHRPIGWAPEFEALSHQADMIDDGVDVQSAFAQIIDLPDAGDASLASLTHQSANGFDPDLRPEAERVTPGTGDDGELPGNADFHNQTEDEMDRTDYDQYAPSDGTDVSELDLEADAIESELSSLRGLVDRLAGERDNVKSSPVTVEPADNNALSRLENELEAVTADLDAVRHELDLSRQELATTRSEREEARRLQSDALRRQVELERELAASREAKSEVDTQTSQLQVSVISLEDKLKRVTADRDELERERNVAQSQLETMTAERNHIREERMAIKAERDDMDARLRDVEEKTGGVDVGELTESNRSLTQELEATSRELARMITQVESLDGQLTETTALAEGLQLERNELSSRLADTELALETTTTKYEALKIDSERLAAEVGSLRAEREALQNQLTELQVSLTEVLDEQADIRHRNDADRKALNELRVERDVLVARMSEIEQTDRSYENRINALVKERDDLMVARDDLVAERGQLRGEAASAASAREQLLEKIESLEGKLGPLEAELQAERRQREELASRLLELDEIASTNQAATEQLTAERDSLAENVSALSTESERAKELERERDQLQTRAERAEQRAESVERQLEDESSKQQDAVSELTDKVDELQSAKHRSDNQLAETQAELVLLRNDLEELSEKNAKLQASLQDAETSLTEATEAAERAKQEAAEAVERAAMVEAASKSGGFGVSALAGTGLGDTDGEAVRADDPVGLDTVDDEPDLPSLEEPDPDRTDAVPIIGDRTWPDAEPLSSSEAAAGFDWTAEDAVSLDETLRVESGDDPGSESGGEPEPSDAFAFLLPGGNPTGDGVDDGADDTDAVDFRPPSLIDESAESGEFDTLSPVDSRSDDTLALDHETSVVSDVVDMEQRRIRHDDGSPFDDDRVALVAPGSDDRRERDELDEIGDLISQAAAGFDGGSLADTPVGSAPDTVASMGLTPPSVFDSDDSRSASNFGRRTIEVPPDLADDEIAVAQYVVSSPDIVLLVDGDSVAQMGWPSLPVAQQRDALVTYLADLSATSGAAPDVVFDGRMGDDDSLPRSQAVRIRLSTPPTEPAAALDELVSAYPEQWPIALVTDDPVLAASALERGATVLNNGQLLDLFIAQ